MLFKFKKIIPKINIPTFDGSGQAVHPDILEFKTPLVNGYKYIMAYTPWPGFRGEFEAPSLIFSEDSLNWTMDKVKNPLVELTPDRYYYHYSDPDLVFANNTLLLYYICDFSKPGKLKNLYKCLRFSVNLLTKQWSKPYKSEILLMQSRNGIYWTDPILVVKRGGFKSLIPSSYLLFSPSVVYDSKFRMWIVESKGCTEKDNKLMYCESIDGKNWDNCRRCNLQLNNYIPWHIDVQRLSNGEYWMLIAAWRKCNCISCDKLFLAFSSDAIHWHMNKQPILDENILKEIGYDSLYRSSFIVENGFFRLWFTGRKRRMWHIGYAESKLEEEYIDIYSSNIIF